jgi:hypothetical protein
MAGIWPRSFRTLSPRCVPFQFNYDEGFGPNDGQKAVLNIQPVIPISLSEDWNMISRTILTVIWQNDIAGPPGEQSGLGRLASPLASAIGPRAPIAAPMVSAFAVW